MVDRSRKSPADDPRLALEVLREEGNLRAASRGLVFSLLLGFNRVMDRVSRSRFGSSDPGERPSSVRRWGRRAFMGVSTVTSSWMALSPRAHHYLSTMMVLAFHLYRQVMGHLGGSGPRAISALPVR